MMSIQLRVGKKLYDSMPELALRLRRRGLIQESEDRVKLLAEFLRLLVDRFNDDTRVTLLIEAIRRAELVSKLQEVVSTQESETKPVSNKAETSDVIKLEEALRALTEHVVYLFCVDISDRECRDRSKRDRESSKATCLKTS